MFTLFISIIAIIVTILFIIGFHEFGHFIVARLLGIKVLRFSIGFGKALKTWRGKSGTEYVLAMVPLGGYVKMLDETEGDVAASERHLAFNRQPVYKRFLVVAAGPIFNFILAIGLYWILFVVGFTTVVPLVGNIVPQSIAAQAGMKPNEEIISIENRSTLSWTAVVMHLMEHLGDDTKITINTQPRGTQITKHYILDLQGWKLNNLRPDPLDSIGIKPYQPQIPTVIGLVEPNSPAAKANLKIGDKVIAINNQPVKDWVEVAEAITSHPNTILQFKIQRKHEQLTLPISVASESSLLGKRVYIGVAPDFELPKDLLRFNQYSPLKALQKASQDVGDFIQLNFMMLGKMVMGKISFQSLGGPITIFEGAGNSLNNGILPFLSFIAFISIAIGVINILPIPGLDGGHILFYVIEIIQRRPLSQRTQELMFRLGFIMLMLLAVQAIANDIMRL